MQIEQFKGKEAKRIPKYKLRSEKPSNVNQSIIEFEKEAKVTNSEVLKSEKKGVRKTIKKAITSVFKKDDVAERATETRHISEAEELKDQIRRLNARLNDLEYDN